MRATACVSRNSLNRVASQRSRCMDARARIFMTVTRSTKPFAKSVHASKFRYSQMVILIRRKKARAVLDFTGATGVMLGRAAHGSPWIFRDVNYFLSHGKFAPALPLRKVGDTILAHLESLYEFYGEETGVRVARKHLGWYFGKLQDAPDVRRELMAASTSASQFAVAKKSLDELADVETTVATWGGLATCAQ